MGHSLLYQENMSNVDSPKPWSLKLNLSAPLKHFPYLHDLKHSDDLASILDCSPPSTPEKNYFLQEVRVTLYISPANCWAFRKEEQESHRKMTQAQGPLPVKQGETRIKNKHTSCKVKNSCCAKSF